MDVNVSTVLLSLFVASCSAPSPSSPYILPTLGHALVLQAILKALPPRHRTSTSCLGLPGPAHSSRLNMINIPSQPSLGTSVGLVCITFDMQSRNAN
jgi:hypothetical protein